MKRFCVAAAALLAVSAAAAQSTPVGLWKTVDDATKATKSLVRVTETNGVLSGRIEKLLDPSVKPDVLCTECKGDLKDKPVLGMVIIRDVKKNADTEGLWDGGHVLDPNNGKNYKVRLKPTDGGKQLEVRGFVGTPMFGRSQTWYRVE